MTKQSYWTKLETEQYEDMNVETEDDSFKNIYILEDYTVVDI